MFHSFQHTWIIYLSITVAISRSCIYMLDVYQEFHIRVWPWVIIERFNLQWSACLHHFLVSLTGKGQTLHVMPYTEHWHPCNSYKTTSITEVKRFNSKLKFLDNTVLLAYCRQFWKIMHSIHRYPRLFS